MFGTVLASIIGMCLLIFGVVIVFMVAVDYMDGSWRWGVRDDSKDINNDKEKEDGI